MHNTQNPNPLQETRRSINNWTQNNVVFYSFLLKKQKLDLSGKGLSTEDFRQLIPEIENFIRIGLRELDMSNNNIEEIPP